LFNVFSSVLTIVMTFSWLNVYVFLQVLEWNVQGLHTDRFSIQNGSLVTSGQRERVLLLIDPQSAAKNWIINVENSRGLQVSRHSCFPLGWLRTRFGELWLPDSPDQNLELDARTHA